MNLNKLLNISTLAGKILLESGAETYRVEETIIRICLAFGAESAESFVIPTGIMVTITYEDQVSTFVRRITSRGVDLNKIDKINTLSREVTASLITLDELHTELKKINNQKTYSILSNLIASAAASGSFAMLFGGNAKDFFCACIIGSIIKLLCVICVKLNINEFFINFIGGGLCAFIAIIFVRLITGTNLDMIIIGSIMLLVPGLTITNAIRDTIAGDTISGITKISEALLAAVSIAAGTGTVLSFFLPILK